MQMFIKSVLHNIISERNYIISSISLAISFHFVSLWCFIPKYIPSDQSYFTGEIKKNDTINDMSLSTGILLQCCYF